MKISFDCKDNSFTIKLDGRTCGYSTSLVPQQGHPCSWLKGPITINDMVYGECKFDFYAEIVSMSAKISISGYVGNNQVTLYTNSAMSPKMNFYFEKDF